MLNAFTADLSLIWHTRGADPFLANGDVRLCFLRYLAFALLGV